MKSVSGIMLALIIACFFACQPDEKNQNREEGAMTAGNGGATDAARRGSTGQPDAPNTVMTNQLAGNWQSKTENGKQMQLLAGDEKQMQYTIISDGKIVDKGKWGSPIDCTACNLTNSDVCFYLDNGKAKTCYTIVRMDRDTLQYFAIDGSGGMKTFVREK